MCLGMNEEVLTDHAARYFYENPAMLKRVIELLRSFDTGIIDIAVQKGVDQNNKETYYSIFKHNTEDGEYDLPYFNQSTGTKLLYNRLMDFIMVIDFGGVLVFDEIDNHLHSDIVPMLISFFLSPEINKHNAQIIFTSHNETILDMMKKYRIYVFKKENNSSFSYRIDEISNNAIIRNDRSLENSYRLGLLGGRPNV